MTHGVRPQIGDDGRLSGLAIDADHRGGEIRVAADAADCLSAARTRNLPYSPLFSPSFSSPTASGIAL